VNNNIKNEAKKENTTEKKSRGIQEKDRKKQNKRMKKERNMQEQHMNKK